MNATKEITLNELLDSYDWSEVFGEGDGGNTDKTTETCPPRASVDSTPPNRSDVAEIIAAVNGENDDSDWIGVFLLKDGRYCVARGGCDYTGWDCRAGNSLYVSTTLEDAVRYALSDDDRERLGLSLA